MLMTRARSFLSIVLLGASATLGGTAHAALYTGTWDPAYGGIFPSLGWHASALFDVPTTCLALGNGVNIPISGACAGFDVVSAKVEFYDIAAPSTILGSYALTPDPYPNVNVTGISLTGGQLSGVDTQYFEYFVPALSIAGGGTYSFSLILFGGDKAQLVYADPITTSPSCSQFPVQGAHCGVSANAATGVFAPVPEPETFALVFAGLGALGFVGRKRRRQ